MLTSDAIANVLKITRSEFAVLFLQAQYNYNVDIDGRLQFEAVASNLADDKEAYKKALDFATTGGFLNEFLQLIMSYGFDEGKLLTMLAENNPNNSTLQSVTNAIAGFNRSGIYLGKLAAAMRWTGKVLINGTFQGSGVLIGPTRFLTAWHVVKPMFRLVPGNGNSKAYYEAIQPAQSLEVVFDDVLGEGNTPGKVKRIRAEQDWYENYAPCHDVELNGQAKVPLPQDMEEMIDYAVIRLAETTGDERRFATLKKTAVVPPPDSKITIFQYPKASDLMHDTDRIVDSDPRDPFIPRLRFLHVVNALDGSSGGPCYDKELSLIGLHQGTWDTTKKINVGIPVLNIINHLEKRRAQDGQPQALFEDYLIASLKQEAYTPVIGCDDFQALVLKMSSEETVTSTAATTANASLPVPVPGTLNAGEETKRAIFIKGEKGSGKTHLIKVLSAMLDTADHLKIVLEAQAISKMDAGQLATTISSLVSGNIPNTTPESYNSSVAAWVRDEVIEELFTTLETSRNGRLVWICVKELNNFEIIEKNTEDFLLLLYEQALSRKWLRIVLDGPEDGLPKSLEKITTPYNTRKITEAEIADYVRRFLKQLKQPQDSAGIANAAAALYQLYNASNTISPATAKQVLAFQCLQFFAGYIEKTKAN